MTFRVEPVFAGKPVVIIAGGESLTLRDIRAIARARLENAGAIRVIAVNDAIYPAWFADWLHACDMKWWTWHIQSAAKFTGIRTTLDPSVPQSWASLLKNTGKEGFDRNPENCRTGGNGAYQAMHCAIHAGASQICLVAVDMDRGGHWFGGHPSGVDVNRPATMLPTFKTLVPALKERGIPVVNASARSLIDCWPKVDLENWLDGIRRSDGAQAAAV